MKEETYIETAPSAFTDYETKRNKPMPSYNHGAIQAKLSFLITLGYEEKYRPISELSLQLDDWMSVPDICLFPYKDLDTDNDVIKTTEVPLCAIEILSPTQTLTELLLKARNYFEKGVKSCWLVLPGVNNIYVFTAANEYEIFKTGEILKDEKLNMEIDVTKVFK